ncbi:Tigger transposable element-derived protein 6, partial [Mortierella sp. AD010]
DNGADSDIELPSASCGSLDLGAQGTAVPPDYQQRNSPETSSPTIKGPDVAGSSVAPKKTKLRNGVPMCIQRKVIDATKQKISLDEIGRMFNLPRSTVSSIKSRENVIRKSQSKDGFRVTKGRLHKVDSIVANWAGGLESKGISVSDKKISAQALEVHRLLSDVLMERLPSCMYTGGWIKGFKRRYGTFLKKQRIHPTQGVWQSWKHVSKALNLSKYQPEDVYLLDVASLFLDVVPRSDVRGESVLGASVLLCCNGAGSFMPNPDITWGLPHQIDSVGHFDSIRLMAQKQYLKLDEMVQRESVLLVNQAMWNYLESIISTPQLRLLKVVLVPNGISSALPMRARLQSEFKAAYHTLILGNSQKAEDTQLGPSIFITDSWTQDHRHAIQESFEGFWVTVVRLAPDQFPESLSQNKKHTNGRLQRAISRLFPGKERKKYEHYLAHDGDIGPSDHIYNLIRMAMDHELESEDIPLATEPDPSMIWANFLKTLL